MTSLTNGKKAPPEAPPNHDASATSSPVSAPSFSVQARYYFNLTDGDTMIRDQEGTKGFSIQAAVLSAMEAVEELRAQDPSNSEEWRGWRLEDCRCLRSNGPDNSLDALSAH